MDIIEALKALADQYGIGGAVLIIALVYLVRSIPVVYKGWLDIKATDTRTEEVKAKALAEDQREENKHINMLIQLVADNQRTTNSINTTTNGILESFRSDIAKSRETDEKLINGFANVALELRATRVSFEQWPNKVDSTIKKLSDNFVEAIEELGKLRVQIKDDHKDIADRLGLIMGKLEGPNAPPPTVAKQPDTDGAEAPSETETPSA